MTKNGCSRSTHSSPAHNQASTSQTIAIFDPAISVLNQQLTTRDKTVLFVSWKKLGGETGRYNQQLMRRAFNLFEEKCPAVGKIFMRAAALKGFSDNQQALLTLSDHAVAMSNMIDSIIRQLNGTPANRVQMTVHQIGQHHAHLATLGLEKKTWEVFGALLAAQLANQQAIRGQRLTQRAWTTFVAVIMDQLVAGFQKGIHLTKFSPRQRITTAATTVQSVHQGASKPRAFSLPEIMIDDHDADANELSRWKTKVYRKFSRNHPPPVDAENYNGQTDRREDSIDVDGDDGSHGRDPTSYSQSTIHELDFQRYRSHTSSHLGTESLLRSERPSYQSRCSFDVAMLQSNSSITSVDETDYFNAAQHSQLLNVLADNHTPIRRKISRSVTDLCDAMESTMGVSTEHLPSTSTARSNHYNNRPNLNSTAPDLKSLRSERTTPLGSPKSARQSVDEMSKKKRFIYATRGKSSSRLKAFADRLFFRKVPSHDKQSQDSLTKLSLPLSAQTKPSVAARKLAMHKPQLSFDHTISLDKISVTGQSDSGTRKSVDLNIRISFYPCDEDEAVAKRVNKNLAPKRSMNEDDSSVNEDLNKLGVKGLMPMQRKRSRSFDATSYPKPRLTSSGNQNSRLQVMMNGHRAESSLSIADRLDPETTRDLLSINRTEFCSSTNLQPLRRKRSRSLAGDFELKGVLNRLHHRLDSQSALFRQHKPPPVPRTPFDTELTFEKAMAFNMSSSFEES